MTAKQGDDLGFEMDAAIDEKARELLDSCNLENPVVALTALAAGFFHLAHMIMHADPMTPHATNERVLEAAWNQAQKHAAFLDETRETSFPMPAQAG
ncbi:MAG: hypothetical protein WCB99_14430 [Candidatus Cybelea sp.]